MRNEAEEIPCIGHIAQGHQYHKFLLYNLKVGQKLNEHVF